MRHRVEGRKLGRKSAHRRAMLANLAASLVLHNRVETTLPKAKELKAFADKLVTLGKRQTIAARQRARALVRSRKAVSRIFGELATRFEQRHGGYTRILKLGFRHGDSAPMAMLEYLPAEGKAATAEEHHGKKGTRAAKPKAPAKKAAGKIPAKKAAPKKPAASGAVKSSKKGASTHKTSRGD